MDCLSKRQRLTNLEKNVSHKMKWRRYGYKYDDLGVVVNGVKRRCLNEK